MLFRAVLIGMTFASLGVVFAACSDDPPGLGDAGTSPTTSPTPTTSTTATTPPSGTATTPQPDSSVPPVDASIPDATADAADAAVVAPTFTTIYTTIISQRCGAGCHLKANGPSGGLRMDTKAQAHANLVGVDVQNACTGVTKRVVARDAAKSKLYVKVSAGAATIAGCGNRMPNPGTTPLPAAEVKAIEAWINAGALDN